MKYCYLNFYFLKKEKYQIVSPSENNFISSIILLYLCVLTRVLYIRDIYRFSYYYC